MKALFTRLINFLTWACLLLPVLAVGGVAAFLLLFSQVEETELQVLPHPTLPIELVWTETQAGATVSNTYKLWARPKGHKRLKDKWLLIHVDDWTGTEVKWTHITEGHSTVELACVNERIWKSQQQVKVRRTWVHLSYSARCAVTQGDKA